jgi:hypothetical protein
MHTSAWVDTYGALSEEPEKLILLGIHPNKFHIQYMCLYVFCIRRHSYRPVEGIRGCFESIDLIGRPAECCCNITAGGSF